MMTGTPVVRTLAEGDFDEIGRIFYEGELAALREAFSDGFPTAWFQLPDVDASVAQCKRYFARPAPVGAFVAEIEREIAGMTLVGARDDQPAMGQVHSLYVDPRAWRRGTGSTLLARGTGWLRENGFERAMLWTIRDNARARGFYESRGWHATGEMWIPRNTPPLIRYERTLDVTDPS